MSGPFSCPYSPEFVEEEFSEVRGSNLPRLVPHPGTYLSSSCTVVYQGVATRNSATTREILAYQAEAQLNFAW
jgi:hypothetical protein